MNYGSERFKMVFTGILSGLIIIMSFIPFLGFIPLGFMNATIIQVPVVIGAIMLGPKRGAFLGLMFGLTSLWKNTTAPNITSFVFSPFVPVPGVEDTMPMLVGRLLKCLFICIFSRVMIGVVAYYLHEFLRKKTKIPVHINNMACGAAGAITNTVFVMGGIYFLYGEAYAGAKNLSVGLLSKVIAGVIFTQGVPEAIVSAILVGVILGVLSRVSQQME